MADATKTRSEMIMATLIAASLSPKLEKLTGMKIDATDVLYWFGVAGYFLHQGLAVFMLYFPPPTKSTAVPSSSSSPIGDSTHVVPQIYASAPSTVTRSGGDVPVTEPAKQ